MDRFAANTLRTLGIIATAIVVILVSAVLLLVALCFHGLLTFGKGPPAPGDVTFVYSVIGVVAFVALSIIGGGITVIAALAREIVRSVDMPQLPTRASLSAGLATLATQAKGLLPSTPQPAHVDVVAHLSHASSAAIQQLTAAIVAKITAEVLLGIVGWFGALGTPQAAPFPVYRFGFMAWGLAAIAPHIILLYALARRPGRTAFAYALIIPTIHILFGIFGHSAFLAFILRAGQVATPLLSIIPWMIDILILYLAWKAARLTGLLPDPTRLIVAAIVIFLYTSLLPLLVVLLNHYRT